MLAEMLCVAIHQLSQDQIPGNRSSMLNSCGSIVKVDWMSTNHDCGFTIGCTKS